MSSPIRPLVVALTGAALVAGGALLWLARDLLGSPSTAGSRPGLLELLEEVRQPAPPSQPPGRPAPKPPSRPRWVSPLTRSCPVVTPSERQRLMRQFDRIDSLVTRIRIDPTNFGVRYEKDAYGNAVDPKPRLVVLHETVYGIGSAIQTFLTPHPRDEDQVSYHMLIGEDGQIVEVLDPLKRGFGAGNSAFNGEWVITNPDVGGSVNNFTLHLSLETPIDGEDAAPSHSGYSALQYDATALVLADWMRRFSIPPEHITTHRYVDLGGERADPRSFDWQALQVRLAALGMIC
jgi:N-acetylmuramoyl-L-alanine amidase